MDQHGVVNQQAGRLELRRDGAWLSVCDDNGDDRQWTPDLHLTHHLSQVVCRMYGFAGMGVVINQWATRTKVSPNWTLGFSQLRCRGDELSVLDCQYTTDLTKPWEGPEARCQPQEALGIYCF